MQFFDYGEQDFIPCEMCGSKATDIHHIERRTRNKVTNDFVENLVGLCRDCHIKAESDSMFNMFCRIQHLENVTNQVYALIEYKRRYENRK
jgi:5-methylcytosine-specific restriction endonuclease McrA